MPWILPAVGAFLILGAILGVWMFVVEPRRFRIWRVRLPRSERRPPRTVALRADRIPNLRLLHITDTHFGTRDEAKLDFIRRVAQETCDLVFLTGDLIDAPSGIEPCLEMVSRLNPRIGMYAVLGGHDHFRRRRTLHKYTSLLAPSPPSKSQRIANPTESLRQGLKRYGVEVMADENQRIRGLPGQPLTVVGLRDAFVFDCDYEKAWSGVGRNEATIVIAHSPDVLPEVVRRGSDLALFGHTHGGQVRLPLIGAVVTRSYINTARARGIFREGETIFTINQGMGAGIRSDFRLLCPPEVTLLRIEKL